MEQVSDADKNKNKKENKIVIREFNKDRDNYEVLENLEKNCETAESDKEDDQLSLSIFTNMVSDPFRRIRFYALRVILVAEVCENGELVGVVRGCIKHVGTRFGDILVKLGCILGLRVSPRHRRMGIGLNLMKSIEEWMIKNGAHYTSLATEKSNIASTNLFTTKCNYTKFGSLVIFVLPVDNSPPKSLTIPQLEIKIEKLHLDQAISLYTNNVKVNKDIYPTDIDSILKESLNLGTWVSYFGEDNEGFDFKDVITTTPRSWVIFSIWDSCETCKLQYNSPQKTHNHETWSHAKSKFFPCLKLPTISNGSFENPFGFLFLYGVYGEGERLGELIRPVLRFASRLAENVKDCKMVMLELGVSDPLTQHVPQQDGEFSNLSCIDDLWYMKKVNGLLGDDSDRDEMMAMMMGQAGINAFVDPRDF